jgi:hypothetical protein
MTQLSAELLYKIGRNPALPRTVADACESYHDILPLWTKVRAICNGQRHVKYYDNILDLHTYSNILTPFSPTMDAEQYRFYQAESELPGFVAQYARTVVGGLLRKEPQIKLPDDAPPDAMQWICDNFTQDDGTMLTFLDDALWEEVQSSRAWISVDYPTINVDLSPEDQKKFKPYPIIHNAESIINWKMNGNPETGASQLSQVIVRSYELNYDRNEFHPDYVDVVYVHELDKNNFYQIRKFKSNTPVGQADQAHQVFELQDTITNILDHGERLTLIPFWPLNGNIEPREPLLMTLVDREISLYNKVSRRNHLLYGAATYTPIISSDMTDEDFDAVVNAGLGSWIKLRQGDTADVLKTPTEALTDMDRAIKDTIEELARMGMRMLSPEVADTSGVALDIRNAPQTAQLGSLNARVSAQMNSIIAFMLNWRYGTKYVSSDITFTLSADFNPAPLGADWLRLVTEWYQGGILPRSVFLQIAKSNDIIPPDYDDEAGQQEITDDQSIVNPADQATFENQLAMQQAQSQLAGPAQPPKPKAN